MAKMNKQSVYALKPIPKNTDSFLINDSQDFDRTKTVYIQAILNLMNETAYLYICHNCTEYRFPSLKCLVTRSLCDSSASLEANLGTNRALFKQEELINLRVKWLEQLEAKLLLELKGK
jgi:hypothetical protein